ncbi:hypothetical protein FX988_03123 [Paraglaciecola mesophila]|uniref:Uncharacterized protein n=1 Tax=Paraglaciecola mesophila TaxID=197222 RepID=A0A857JLC3_9ALTE|nr:hypothetical protein FX988_03123 [Paraglaciecola mesophila]
MCEGLRYITGELEVAFTQDSAVRVKAILNEVQRILPNSKILYSLPSLPANVKMRPYEKA